MLGRQTPWGEEGAPQPLPVRVVAVVIPATSISNCKIGFSYEAYADCKKNQQVQDARAKIYQYVVKRAQMSWLTDETPFSWVSRQKRVMMCAPTGYVDVSICCMRTNRV